MGRNRTNAPSVSLEFIIDKDIKISVHHKYYNVNTNVTTHLNNCISSIDDSVFLNFNCKKLFVKIQIKLECTILKCIHFFVFE